MEEKIIKKGISYLIPSYNHAQYIIYLLDSILEDSNKINMNSEIILIDDGSIDNTKEILTKWEEINKDNIAITFLYQENKGLNATLNKLISLSSYQYLRLCGSDDIIIPGSSKNMYACFLDDLSLTAVSGDGFVIDSEGITIYESSIKYYKGRINKLTDPKLVNSEIILNWCIAGPSTLIKRSHFDNISYDENEIIDDFFLFLSIVNVNGLKIIPNKVNKYRIHNANTTNQKDIEKRLKNQKSFLTCILSFKMMENKYPALSAVRNLSEAKIAYLEKNYFNCLLKMIAYFYYRLKV